MLFCFAYLTCPLLNIQPTSHSPLPILVRYSSKDLKFFLDISPLLHYTFYEKKFVVPHKAKGETMKINIEKLNKKLIEACEKGNLSKAKKLTLRIGNGIDTVYGIIGETPLMCASRNNQLDICKFLLENGADVNAKGIADYTALMKAAGEGNLEICRLLIDNGADISATNSFGDTAFDLAVSVKSSDSSHKEVCALLGEPDSFAKVKKFIENGGDINAKNVWSTLLVEASASGYTSVCKLLIENGADPNAMGGASYTALMMAARKGNLDICRLLIDNGAKINISNYEGNELVWAIMREDADNLEVCKFLIKNGAEVNAQDEYGRTPLMVAAQLDKTDVCRLLIENGANVNAFDRAGDTPLIWAAIRGNAETCKALIELGAEVKIKDRSGANALKYGGNDIWALLRKYTTPQTGDDESGNGEAGGDEPDDDEFERE